MPFPYNKLTEAGITYLRSVTDPDRVFERDQIKEEYTHDEMPEYGTFMPDLVIEVINKEEISAIMKFANEQNIPVIPRGAGTGLAGGATAKFGGIVLSVMRMNKILELDMANLSMTVEPGVLLMEVAQAAVDAGLFYPPDPGEKTASIGGTVMCNAGGMRAVRYGVTRDYVRAIEAVLPDGEIVEFSSNVVKNTTGYDIKDLIIGSEGTLCIATKITLKLISLPKWSYSLLVPFENIDDCIDTVPKILQSHLIPTAVEYIERNVIGFVETHLGKIFPDQSADSYLLLMFDGNSKEEVELSCDSAAEICLKAGAKDVLLCNSDERKDAVWSIRGSVLEGIKADTTSEEECDVVVPRSKIAEYIKAAKKIGAEHQIRIVTIGHAGDGNIHTELLRDDLSDDVWKEQSRLVLNKLYAKSKELGGQLSGEHGIGHGRVKDLEHFIGDRMYQLFQSVKLAFDENNILNPGKVVEIRD